MDRCEGVKIEDKALCQTDKDEEESDAPLERSHVDVLLDISEETCKKELGPYDYICYTRWDDAVQGWEKAAPLSCILITQNIQRKPKHKEANSLPANSTPNVSDSFGKIVEHPCKCQIPLQDAPASPIQETEHVVRATECAVPAPTEKVPMPTEKVPTPVLKEETIEKVEVVRETSPKVHRVSPKPLMTERRVSKHLKYRHKHNNVPVPIKNFTFLPPIKSLRLNPKGNAPVFKYKKFADAETSDGKVASDRKSTTKRRAESASNSDRSKSTVIRSTLRRCKRNLLLISTLHLPKRCHVPVPS